MRKVTELLVVLISTGTLMGGSIFEPVTQWTFDEGSGIAVNDSADGHNGTAYGNPAWTTAGKIGGCMDFDGINDYVNFGDIDQFEFGANNFSISFWFYTKGQHDIGQAGNHNAAIITKYSISTGRQWFIGQGADGTINYSTFHTNGYPAPILFSTNSFFGQWVHVTATKADSRMYLYINGILDGSGPSSGTTTGYSTNVLVGALKDGSTSYQNFNGMLDDIRVYDYALNENEVFQLYTIPEPLTIVVFAIGSLTMIGRKL